MSDKTQVGTRMTFSGYAAQAVARGLPKLIPARAGRIFSLLLMLMAFAGQNATAQNLFAPAVRVNDAVVTNYELQQRILFLQVLRQPGNLEDVALDALIDDRLRFQAARAAGISVSEERIEEGMTEFAARAELTSEQFIQAIGQDGVAAETFRDFVHAGIAWREVIGGRFAPRVQITEAEIDRALALASGTGGVRVLLSEIIIPAPPESQNEARVLANQISSSATSPGAFAEQARRHSASASRGRGGRIDWLPIGNLPPAIRAQILTLAPGDATAPIEVPNAIAIFMLRAIEETDAPEQDVVSVEYARYFIPGGQTERAQSEAVKVAGDVDTCDDLYGVNLGKDESRLERVTQAVGEVPDDIVLELARLDDNEVSTALTAQGPDGPELVFLMLCGRVSAIVEDLSREEIRSQLRQQRLSSYADSYLAELKADATISKP